MSEHDHDDVSVGRRHLIRGGAVLAGAAGLTAVGAALAPKASAANGDNIVQGSSTTGTTTTAVELTGAANNTTPTLQLTNANGPTLQLSRLADAPTNLLAGQIANTDEGPYIGITDGTNTGTGYLITNFDLDQLPVPRPLTPIRILDTRSGPGDVVIQASSATPFDSSRRLKGGQWIDIAVDVENAEYVVEAAFFNLTVTGALAAGYLTAYPPGARPVVAAINFAKTATLSNSGFSGTGLLPPYYLLRVYASQTTHVLLDLTGLSVLGPTGTLDSSARSAAKRPKASRRVVRTLRKRSR